MRRNKKRKCYY